MKKDQRLDLAEELILLALDDETGRLVRGGAAVAALDRAVAAAVLMELALAHRIDTDSKRLFVISPEPIGIALADEVLNEIAQSTEAEPSSHWVQRLSLRGERYRAQLIAQLVERGILKEVDQRLLWVLRQRAYPQTDGRAEQEVKGRITALIQGDDIPTPHDALLVGLVDAAGLFHEVIDHGILTGCRPRITRIANLEELSRSLRHTIQGLQRGVSAANT